MLFKKFVLVGFLTPLLSSCGGFSSGERGHGNSNEVDSGGSAPTQDGRGVVSNNYRLLTAVKHNSFVLDNMFLSVTDADFSSACERYLNFNTIMTGNRVISAREIQVPLEEQEEFQKKVSVVKARKTMAQPEGDRDIVYQSQERIIYEDQGYEERTFTRYFSGICIGTEYITE
jgi:hypothetical protein